MTLSPTLNFDAARAALSALCADAARLPVARRRGVGLHALADVSLWALALMRGAQALRALTGSSLGLSTALRLVFHIDVWSDDIGPGLRLPHPFNVVIGEGVHVGAGCTLMHNVTVQRGAGTTIGDGSVLAAGSTVLAGANVGRGSLVGAASVVRGRIPPGSVAVGAPARVVRNVREDETGAG
jgi:serine acetyltransferase